MYEAVQVTLLSIPSKNSLEGELMVSGKKEPELQTEDRWLKTKF